MFAVCLQLDLNFSLLAVRSDVYNCETIYLIFELRLYYGVCVHNQHYFVLYSLVIKKLIEMPFELITYIYAKFTCILLNIVFYAKILFLLSEFTGILG